MEQAYERSNVPHVEAVVLGPPDSGKAHLLGRLLIDYGAFDRRVVERFMGPASDLYSRMVPARRRLEGLIRTRDELARGITLATRRFQLCTKRYPLSLANVPSLGYFERSCITGAANADFALMVVSAAAPEFEACMADRKAKSLFEVALVAKGCGIEQLVVVLTKADEVLKELKPGQGTREHQALIEDRERRVVALLLSMQFKKENIQVVSVSVWEEQGVLTPLFANGLSLRDALENIRWEELPMARTRRQQGPSAPFRLAVLGAVRIGGIGTVVSGRLVSGRWDTPSHSGRELAFYPQTKSKQQTEGWRQHARGAPVQTGSVESFHEDVSTPVRAGACISVQVRRVPRVLFYAGMVARDAREDAKTSLELTVTEFAVSVRAINPVQSKSPWRVLSIGQEVMVYSHSARVTCKVMAILSVKRGKKQTKRVLREARMGEVAEVRLRPLAALVVEPFDVCPHLGRVLLRDTVTLAFGRVLRVVRRLNNPEKLWELLCLEPACLLGRDEHNNTLLHLLIYQRQEGVEQVVQQVEKHFGRLTVQKLMRVRNSRGHTAIHLALTAGLFGVAAALLSYGAPLTPSKEEERRLSKLWKKPIPSPIDGLRQRCYKRSPVNLALLCLMVLTRDRDDFANLDEMLPPKAMQEHYTIALNSLLLQLTPA